MQSGLTASTLRAGFTWDGMLHKMSQKQWDAMLAVHCTAPFRLIQAAAPVMREAAKKELDEQGQATQRCIINVSSTSGTHGNAGQANYSTVLFCLCSGVPSDCDFAAGLPGRCRVRSEEYRLLHYSACMPTG